MSTRMHIVLDDDLVKRIDYLRGIASRSAWVRDIIERACHGTNIDAAARSADQAERTVPAPADPEQFQRTINAQAEAAERQERSRAQARQPKVPPTSAKELEGLKNIAGLQRASNFVKPSAAMERQRKLNEGKG